MRNVFIVLLVFSFCSITISAQVKSFNDLKYINSETQFIKTCVENGYSSSGSNEISYLEYGTGFKYSSSGYIEGAHNWAYFLKKEDEIWNNRLYKDEWVFSFSDLPYDRTYGSCDYDNIYKEVKNKCQFFGVVNVGDDKVVCYSCSGSTYKGKIGFLEITQGWAHQQLGPPDRIVNGRIFHIIPSLHQ